MVILQLLLALGKPLMDMPFRILIQIIIISKNDMAQLVILSLQMAEQNNFGLFLMATILLVLVVLEILYRTQLIL